MSKLHDPAAHIPGTLDCGGRRIQVQHWSQHRQGLAPKRARVHKEPVIITPIHTVCPLYVDKRFVCKGEPPSVVDAAECRPWAQALGESVK